MQKRGTQDEVEAIKMILNSNRILYNKVLQRIRDLRQEMSESAIDSAREKFEKRTEIERKSK